MKQQRDDRTRPTTRAIPANEALDLLGTPKALIMLAAGLSFLMSVYLFFSGNHEQGIFVGIWVPSILSAGALLLGGNGRE